MEQSENLFLQYVDTIKAVQKRINLKGMYKWICEYEDRFKCPLINMSAEQLASMIQDRVGISISTIRDYISAIKGFYIWAQVNGHCSINPAETLTYQKVDFSQGIQKKCYRCYSDIASLLKRKWTVDEGKSVFPITIFAWLGIPIADAQLLMPADIDLVSGHILHPSQNGFCIWTDEMKSILSHYASFQSSRRDNDITMLRDYSCKTFLFRLEVQNAKAQAEPGRIVSISDELGDASRTLRANGICDGLSYAEIAKSGILNRMYLMECAGETESSVLQYGLKPLKIPSGYPGDIKIIYESYKKAFGLK